MPAMRNTRPRMEEDILKDGRLLKSLARHQMRKVNMSVPETHREKTVSLITACMGDDCGVGGFGTGSTQNDDGNAEGKEQRFEQSKEFVF